MIFLEGVDGSGKTTLGHTLAQTLELQLFTSRPRPVTPQQLAEQVSSSSGVISESGLCHIHDRSPVLSELIYGKVLRKGYVDSHENMRKYLMQFVTGDDFVIYCRPPLHNIRDNIQNSEQMKGVPENWWYILLEYESFFNTARFKYFFRFDYTNPNQMGELLDELKLYIRLKSTNQYVWKQFL